jgi:WD40 repeat protein
LIRDYSDRVIHFDVAGKELARTKLPWRTDATLSPSGHIAFFEYRDGWVLRVRDAGGKQVFGISLGRDRYTSTLALSPDGKRVAIGLRDPVRIKVWDTTTGKKLYSVEADLYASPVCFSNDGKALLSRDRKVWKLDVETGKRHVDFASPDLVKAAAFSPDGKRVVVGCGDATLRVYDSARGTRLNADNEAEGHLQAVAFSPDSKLLLAGGHDGVVRLWDVKTGRVVKRLLAGKLDPHSYVRAIAFSRDGKRAAAVGSYRPGIVWDVASGKVLHRIELFNRAPRAVVFSADGETLFGGGVSIGRGSSVFRWDLKKDKELPEIGPEGSRYRPVIIEHLQLSRDGKTLVAQDIFGATVFLDAVSGKELRKFKLPSRCAQLTSDGKRLVGVNGTGKFEFYDSADGKLVRSWQGVPVGDVRLSPDDKLVAGTTGLLLRVWETASGRPSRPVVSDTGAFGAVAYSPDGKWLAACDGASVILYQTRALRRVPVYRLTADQWRWCWEEVGDKHTFSDAMGLLSAAGDTWVPLARKLLTRPPVDAKRATKLIEVALGKDRVASENAVAELVKLGEGVRHLIDNALKAERDAGAWLRLFAVRRRLPGPDETEESVRAPRIVSLLRQLDSQRARALLADIAGGRFGNVWRDAAKVKERQ